MRLLEIIIPDKTDEELDEVFDDHIIEKWSYVSEDNDLIYKILLEDEHSKELLAKIEKNYKDYRVVIYPVEGTLPKVSDKKKTEEQKIKIGKFFTISKEELYSDIDDPVDLTANFILMVVLSSFVAGIGILKESIPIIIGAMVIAPFLSPNMSLAFGTTLGDWPIVRKSIFTGGVAILIGLAISLLWGYFAHDVGSIARDDNIALRDVLLALACGFAGVITVVSGQGATLVGVMVAAALLPPLIRAGLLAGGGHYASAVNSFLIFSANVICVNIAGIVTFYSAGIRPQNWWEKEKSQKHMRNAIIFWAVALALLIGGIILLNKFTDQ